MVRLAVILIALLTLGACADVIPLTGGPRDEAAPKPTSLVPEQGSRNIQTKSVKIEFDEYIKLQDAATTLSMSPSVGPLTTDISKKTLTVSWKEELKPETTYILNFNGTIRDNNEGNDTIFQVVFSTGSSIDSLSRKGRIASAYSGEPISNATIVLFSKDSIPYKNEPSYTTRSDKFGNFSFSYLKKEDYKTFAYVDQNKNQKIDPTENIAFQEGYTSTSDSALLQLRLFKPNAVIGKLLITIEKPGTAILSGKDFTTEQPRVNGTVQPVFDHFRADSIRIALPSSEDGRYTFISGTDTIVRLFPVKDRNSNFRIQSQSKKEWQAGDTLHFSVPEIIEDIDQTDIVVESESKQAVPYSIQFKNTRLQIVPSTTEDFTVFFGPSALSGPSNSNDTIRFSFETFVTDECSTLILDVSDFDSTWVFELINSMNTEQGKVVRRVKSNASKLRFEQLIPVTYSIRCFQDKNGNGKWDSGDYENGIQPEEMKRFPIRQKLRPNWEVEEKLSIR